MADNSKYYIYVLDSTCKKDADDTTLKKIFSNNTQYVSKILDFSVVHPIDNIEKVVKIYSNAVLKCISILDNDIKDKNSDKDDDEEVTSDDSSIEDKAYKAGKKIGKAIKKVATSKAGKAIGSLAVDMSKNFLNGAYGDVFRTLGGDKLLQAWSRIKYQKDSKFEPNKKASIKVTIILSKETVDDMTDIILFFDTVTQYDPRRGEAYGLYFDFIETQEQKFKIRNSKNNEDEGQNVFGQIKEIKQKAEQSRWKFNITKYTDIINKLKGSKNEKPDPNSSEPQSEEESINLYRYANMILEAYKTNYFVDILFDKDSNPSLPPTTFENLADALKYALKNVKVNKTTQKGHIDKSRRIISLSAINSENEPWRVLDTDYNLSRPCKDFSNCWDKVEDLLKNKKHCIMIKAKKSEIDKCTLMN